MDFDWFNWNVFSLGTRIRIIFVTTIFRGRNCMLPKTNGKPVKKMLACAVFELKLTSYNSSSCKMQLAAKVNIRNFMSLKIIQNWTLSTCKDILLWNQWTSTPETFTFVVILWTILQQRHPRELIHGCPFTLKDSIRHSFSTKSFIIDHVEVFVRFNVSRVPIGYIRSRSCCWWCVSNSG